MKSRLLARLVRQALEEAPPRSPQEVERLAAPRTAEAAALLALLPVLDHLPLDESHRQFVPLFRRALEGVALDCEAGGLPVFDELGERSRSRVRDFLAALRVHLAP